MGRFGLLSLFLLATPAVALACLWDRDTPREEAKGLPEVVAALTGRFPRNPPLYYQMRLERVTKRLQEQPDDLEAYDDAGVACDRLGLGDDAIAWMAKKRLRLDALPPNDAHRREHEYRYHANLGTFQLHRWIRSGADRENMEDVRAARDEVALGLEINPDAHFGREKYQLRFLEWLLNPPSLGEVLPNFLNLQDMVSMGPIEPDEARRHVRGLTGLIVLGNAWESVDVYNPLMIALSQDTEGFANDRSGGRNSLAYLAWLRCRELTEAGKGSLLPGTPSGEDLLKLIPRPDFTREGLSDLDASYRLLRDDADAWQKARTDFMTARLATGSHPDFDDDFWKGYSETPPPELPDVSPKQTFDRWMKWRTTKALWIFGGVAAVILGLVATLIVRAISLARVEASQEGVEADL